MTRVDESPKHKKEREKKGEQKRKKKSFAHLLFRHEQTTDTLARYNIRAPGCEDGEKYQETAPPVVVVVVVVVLGWVKYSGESPQSNRLCKLSKREGGM